MSFEAPPTTLTAVPTERDGDHAKVRAAQAGDQAAFRVLVDRHSGAVYRLCWRIVRDESLAEDAAQEAFYRAWRALPEFDGRAAFSTWLHRIAANAALEQLRRGARHRSLLQESQALDQDEPVSDLLAELACDGPGPPEQVQAQEISRRVGLVMQAMSALERSAFVLRHFQGESLEQIGAQLDLNLGQTKQAVFRAVRKLRAALADWS